MGRFIDLTGRRFGRLVVTERVQLVHGKKPLKPHWLVQCDCGTTKIVGGSDLKLGKVVSCKCYARQMTSVRTKQSDPQAITINSIVAYYRRNAKHKGLRFELSYEDCVTLFLGTCFYCGQLPSKIANIYLQRKRSSFITDDVFTTYNFLYNGIDRVNNKLGYLNGNGQCVSCCSFCNNAKLDLTLEEWRTQIIHWSHLANHQKHQLQHVDTSSLNKFQVDTFQEIVRSYKRSAEKRNLEMTLSEHMLHTLFQQPCHYCGVEYSNLTNKYIAKDGSLVKNKGCPLKKTTEFDRSLGYYSYNGIDRRDNLIGYIESNCVTCCMICNHAKEDMPYNDFLRNIERLVSYQKLSGTLSLQI